MRAVSAVARFVVPGVLLVGLAVAPAASAGGGTPTCHGRAATIVGTNHADTIHGTAGDDVIVSKRGPDVVWGGGGDDVICAGAGEYVDEDFSYGDRLHGGAGRDTLDGGPGEDQIYGDGGADHLVGGRDSDTLVDGSGNDHANGGIGDDRFVAGRGDDVLIGGPDDEAAGKNSISFAASPSGVVVDLRADTATGYGDDEVRHIWGVEGSPYADVIRGTKHADTLAGGCGNDVIRGRGGDDALALNDAGQACDGGQPDKDRVYGGDGDDGFQCANTGRPGADRLFGGRGKDVFFADGARDHVDGGPGFDFFDANEVYSGAKSLEADLAAGTYRIGANAGTLTAVEFVSGTDNDDTIVGGPGDDFLVGALGSDVLRGRGGDDVLRGEYLPGGSAEDVVYGGPGYDNCRAGEKHSCETSTSVSPPS
jgi:Ca2+-binding RTX toxin-like protein